ncbi:helix-turn-helix domain-containing protein [Streptomyces sp. NPDC091412]|uniref:AraC-like ligand-binding domain-containing protein n=1 Tax=Streptomyces sp. NPDC091412 TaxID=3366002 RepID=UPI00382732AF
METVLRTEELSVAERFESWCDLTSRALVPTVLTPVDTGDFRAEARLLELGAVRISVMSYPTLRSRRTPALVRRSDPELYQVALTRRGKQQLSQCRRDALVGPGDLLLYDTSHPFDARAALDGKEVEVIVVHVPRAALPLPAAKIDRTLAVPTPGHTGVGALLSQFLVPLVTQSACYRPQDAVRLGAVTMDLVTTFLAHRLGLEGAVPPESRQQTLMVSVHAFIERNLGDPQLSPEVVATAHHISVRYLHRLFQRQGASVGGWIRQRRLERCRRDLSDPQLAAKSIGFVRMRWGFVHASDFARAFRTAFGVPPSTYRHTMLHEGLDAARQLQCTQSQHRSRQRDKT